MPCFRQGIEHFVLYAFQKLNSICRGKDLLPNFLFLHPFLVFLVTNLFIRLIQRLLLPLQLAELPLFDVEVVDQRPLPLLKRLDLLFMYDLHEALLYGLTAENVQNRLDVLVEFEHKGGLNLRTDIHPRLHWNVRSWSRLFDELVRLTSLVRHRLRLRVFLEVQVQRQLHSLPLEFQSRVQVCGRRKPARMHESVHPITIIIFLRHDLRRAFLRRILLLHRADDWGPPHHPPVEHDIRNSRNNVLIQPVLFPGPCHRSGLG
mmetsp:Transcript_7229/g.13453  ORF Transcript_7229/g.13453 Transcript_7229/m.13453 type:complete len:261 (-) Transcript_7229:102-884(-)